MQRSQNQMKAKAIVEEAICSKNLSTPSCIDLVITHSSSMFQKTKTLSTGSSHFHKISLKHFFRSSSQKELIYRGCKNFDGVIYKGDLVGN